jgi:hypothetical protein
MKGGVCSSEVDKCLYLLPKSQWQISLSSVLEDWTKPFF